MPKSAEAFRTISEVAEWLETPAHVLRFWESKFTQIKPVKRAGGRRYYRPADMELLGGIKRLLHEDGMTIKGVQKILREQGIRHVASLSPGLGDEFRAVLDDDHASETIDIEAHAEPQSGEVLHFKPAQPASPAADDPAPGEPVQGELIPKDPVDDDPQPEAAVEPHPEEAEAHADPLAAKGSDGPPPPKTEEQHSSTAPGAVEESPAAAEEPVQVESPGPGPAAPAPKRQPRIIETPPDPTEADMDVPPGFLTRLMARNTPFDEEQKTALAPLLQRLTALRDGMSAAQKD